MIARQLELQALPGEDALPTDDGLPMESMDHRGQMNILVDTLDEHWKDRSDVCVAGNLPLYFSAHQVLKNDFLAPDVMIVLDTERRQRRSWVVWHELRAPDVVIELLSPSTEANDRGPKMQTYAKTLGVSEYYLYDVTDGRFEGYALDHRRHMYTVMTPDEDGGITSATLGLRLIPTEMSIFGEPRLFLRWHTLDGQIIPTGAERAESERTRAEALAAKLRALGIDPEA